MERTLAHGFDIELSLLLEALNVKYGCDFRHYSPASMKRMIVQAMNQMACPNLAALQSKVLGDSKCYIDLIQYLTIPVTEMFRDPSYFLALREKVVPILKTYPSIRVWVAGCSTGEEVYSLAILFKEEDLLERTTIYATDINPKSLEKAERGIFSSAMIRKFDSNHRESGGKRPMADFYTVTPDSIKFESSLKKNITFADHSLVTDAVFSEAHLISCRNVLIYFDRELQDKVFELFHESLCRKGFLGLGSKETVQFSKQAKYFDSFVPKDRIYRKNSLI